MHMLRFDCFAKINVAVQQKLCKDNGSLANEYPSHHGIV